MKDNPDVLCEECKKFSAHINGQHGPNASCDVLVVCNHDQPERLNPETAQLGRMEILRKHNLIGRVSGCDSLIS